MSWRDKKKKRRRKKSDIKEGQIQSLQTEDAEKQLGIKDKRGGEYIQQRNGQEWRNNDRVRKKAG